MANDPFICSELFCGAGGLSEGFQRAGFSILSANDFDEHAVATMRATHPETRVIPGPIQDVSANELLRDSGLKKGELDVLSGGPPCQAFSVYNHQRGMHDERSGLFREYLRVVEELNPKFIVMENVTGILSIEEGLAVKEIEARLTKLGYQVEHRVLKAEEYGVPQERRRVFFVANRLGLKFEWPKPTHGNQQNCGNGVKPFVTVWDAIGDLPPLKILEGEEMQDYGAAAQSDYQKQLRVGAKKLYNHVAPHLAPINLDRLKFIKPGGSWRDIPVRLLPAGMKKARRCDHTKRYGRLEKKGLASTILTKCDLHWGAYIHPTQDRTLTVREAARLQSFPDRFQFSGPRVEQFRQVGNAVPPLLAQAVGQSVLRCLKEHRMGGAAKVVSRRSFAVGIEQRELANVD
jgi:DNA (cytosine-5)-methyltransferase 1